MPLRTTRSRPRSPFATRTHAHAQLIRLIRKSTCGAAVYGVRTMRYCPPDRLPEPEDEDRALSRRGDDTPRAPRVVHAELIATPVAPSCGVSAAIVVATR